MPSNKPALYNAKDWKHADRLERILIHLVEPERWPLNQRDNTYFERIRKCFIVVTSNFSEQSVMSILKHEFPTMNSRQLLKLKQDTTAFYTRFDIESKTFDRIKQRARIMKHLEAATSSKDWAAVARLEKELRLMRLEIKEDLQEIPEIPDFDFTTDPKYFDTEFTDYEEEETGD